MHTAVAHTSTRAFHQLTRDGNVSRQKMQILAVIGPNPADYSMQELHRLTGLPTSTLSARLYSLREEDCLLEHGPARQCSISRVTIHPHRRPQPQRALF
ncbi:helix-turn-helix domain-containing protein [Cupriavidus sp. CV2]|uniref:helix-turn-helix domain-containing protein n=1 Tax=Cupriavidus ulmosensis TaxID=3065913 RepID=UPI00296B300E|nr:helix-turn-helix domain-containing protein [Cupriavidus sp. CV2]MDW3683922.1 helix-turn-helix domain-containing protein [Cupriavidus sp. CV2]